MGTWWISRQELSAGIQREHRTAEFSGSGPGGTRWRAHAFIDTTPCGGRDVAKVRERATHEPRRNGTETSVRTHSHTGIPCKPGGSIRSGRDEKVGAKADSRRRNRWVEAQLDEVLGRNDARFTTSQQTELRCARFGGTDVPDGHPQWKQPATLAGLDRRYDSNLCAFCRFGCGRR